MEEALGIIHFECITNDRLPDHLLKLTTLKNIFSRQLPKMPREYIVRLVFDRNHYSFCLVKKGIVIGGVCFRPFFPQVRHKSGELANGVFGLLHVEVRRNCVFGCDVNGASQRLWDTANESFKRSCQKSWN